VFQDYSLDNWSIGGALEVDRRTKKMPDAEISHLERRA
jgi:hypothetical protein